MANMKDVARLAGVGMGTVSRVLNESGYVSASVRKRVRSAMEQLNYTPNCTAQTLKGGKNKIIGLFVPTVSHPFFSAIAGEIETCLDRRGYKLLLVCSQNSAEKESGVIRLIASGRVDGAIFITHYRHNDILPDYPIVTLDRHLGENVPCVTSDNFESSRRATEYLLKRSGGKIGYLGGKPKVDSEVGERLNGYCAAMRANGREERILFEEIAHGEEANLAEKFFDRYPDAEGALVSGDMLALALYREAEKRGGKVPEDFKIVSYDGVLDSWVKSPKFTFIRQDIPNLSEAIVDQLVRKIEGRQEKKKIIVPSLFEEGETT